MNALLSRMLLILVCSIFVFSMTQKATAFGSTPKKEIKVEDSAEDVSVTANDEATDSEMNSEEPDESYKEAPGNAEDSDSSMDSDSQYDESSDGDESESGESESESSTPSLE